MYLKQYARVKVSTRVNFTTLNETIPITKSMMLSLVVKVPSTKWGYLLIQRNLKFFKVFQCDFAN